MPSDESPLTPYPMIKTSIGDNCFHKPLNNAVKIKSIDKKTGLNYFDTKVYA